MKASRKLLLCAIMTLLIIGFAFGLFQQATQPPNTAAQTLAFERAAILRFTLNPASALSSTPGFAEIIYNSVLRNLTEVPYPPRPCYLDPGLVALGLATPIRDCKPFIESFSMSDAEYTRLNQAMSSAGIPGSINARFEGLSRINDAAYSGFTPAWSTLYISVNSKSIEDMAAIADLARRLLNFILDQWESIQYVTGNADIVIEIVGSDGTRYVFTTYTQILETQQRQLSDIQLLEALGGLQERPKD